MNMEQRIANNAKVGIVKRADGQLPTVTGYAAVFYHPDDPGTEYELWDNTYERIAPGAFDRALSEGHDVRGLINHDSDSVIGRTKASTMRLSIDKVGLKYEIDVADTQHGRDVVTSIERGDISGSSFAFFPTRTVWVEEGDLTIRIIEDLDLVDVGPVTFPAYQASTTGTRSADAIREELERFRSENRYDESVGVADTLAKLDIDLANE